MIPSITLKPHGTFPLFRLTCASLIFLPFSILKAQKTSPPRLISQTIEDLIHSSSSAEKLTKGKGLTMILFYRQGCPYCRKFLPTFQKLADIYLSQCVTFRQVRFSDDYHLRTAQKKDLNQQYQIAINTFPCIAVLKRGQKRLILQGDQKEREFDQLAQLIEEYLKK